MKLIKGVKTDRVFEEGYMIEKERLRANISAEKIMPVIERFVAMNQDEEFSITMTVSLHIYRLTGMYGKMVQALFENMGELLINDGLSSFAINAYNGDALIKETCNEYHFHSSRSPKRYKRVLEKENIKQKKALIFFKDERENIHTQGYRLADGTDIYDAIAALKMLGMRE